MKSYFIFNKDIEIVSGAKRAAIYDLKSKRIFSINETAKNYLLKLKAGEAIEKVFFDCSKEDKSEFYSYLDLLSKNEIGYYSDEKIKFTVSAKNDIKLEINTVWFELRKACNMHCSHCYLDSNISSDKNLNIMTLEDWKKVIKELVKYNPGKIILIGGEPLMFKEIDKLIEHIRKYLKGVEIVLYSNLTMINDKLIDVLAENNVKVITSIYSNVQEIHDRITGIEGSFNRTVNAVKKLKQRGIYVKANVVVMKYNQDNISDILKFTYNLTKVKSKIDIVRDVGKSKSYLLPEKISKSFSRIRRKPDFKGIDRETYIHNISGNSCFQGKINICCDGSITPCIMENKFIDKSFNVKINSLYNILKEYIIPSFWKVSKDYIKVCSDCEYRYACKDCRPINQGNNDMFLRGDFCTYNPYTGKWE